MAESRLKPPVCSRNSSNFNMLFRDGIPRRGFSKCLAYTHATVPL